MNALHIVAIVILTMFAYSLGAIISGHKKQINPALLDIMVIVFVIAGAIFVQQYSDKWLYRLAVAYLTQR